MASKPTVLLSPRDRDLLAALERSPLTVRQLLKLSDTFSYPFTTERRAQERLQSLCRAGWVRRFPYATAGIGALHYFTLSPMGWSILHGPKASVPHARTFRHVSISRQEHTRALADTYVHTAVAARHAGLVLADFQRENTLRLQVGEMFLYPDNAFQLRKPTGETFRYFTELDTGTEPVCSSQERDCWERKLRFYDAYQDATLPVRFRVLLITTGGLLRLQHMLDATSAALRDPRRSLVYGITLGKYLAADEPLADACFRDHRQKRVSLVPRYTVSPPPTVAAFESLATAPALC